MKQLMILAVLLASIALAGYGSSTSVKAGATMVPVSVVVKPSAGLPCDQNIFCCSGIPNMFCNEDEDCIPTRGSLTKCGLTKAGGYTHCCTLWEA